MGRLSANATGGALLVCLAALAASSALGGTNSSWYARSWQTDEGLPNNTITSLAQTPDGYLWLGTPSGLVRFDGISFEEFAPSLFIPPPNRGVVAMTPASDGSLWLAMDRGAVVHLKGSVTTCYTAGLPHSIPNVLAQDGQGTLWVGYRGGAVYWISPQGVVGVAEGFPQGGDICALATDSKGQTWFAKNGQFGVISNGVFITLDRGGGAPARLAPCREGGVWLTRGARIFKSSSKGELREMGELKPEQGAIQVNALLEDAEGGVWIATSYSGLFRFDGTVFEAVETTHQEVLALVYDREGNLWAGTQGGGLNRVRHRAITLEGTESGLPFPAVQSICQDVEGTLWAVTQSGSLVRRGPAGWAAVAIPPGGPGEASCVAADPHGGIWAGARMQGLLRWRDGNFVSWGDPGPIQGRTLHTLLVSRSGDLWMGCEIPPSLARLRGKELRLFEAPPDSRVIRAITEDSAGNIWAGTSKGVLLRVSGDRLTEVEARAQLGSIRALYSGSDGALWIGYAGWGLGRLQGDTYSEIRSEHGLYDDYLSHILLDDHGWFWFGANRGIFKVRQNDLVQVADGKALRVRSIYYGRGEGLPSLQAMFGDSPGALRSRDGRLWLPMRTGLAVVEPTQLREEFEPPETLLCRVAVDEQTVAFYPGVLPLPTNSVAELKKEGRVLHLAPGHRHLEFTYSALNFSAPENIQFRYRLNGFDENWVETGSHRVASYSRLPAGSYRFEVAACNMDGRWGTQAASVALIVAPFWYQTWWARAGALAAFTLCLVALVRYVSFRRLQVRLRLLEAQATLHKERARIAKDIHDDVGANLTQIALLGDLAREDRAQDAATPRRIEKISGLAREAIKSLDEIVWAVNPRNDTLAHSIDYTGQYALDYLRVAGVRCRLDLPEQTPERQVSTDVRHNLFLIVKEALHNTVKHAHAQTVWVRVQVEQEGLRLEVQDDGCGFDPAPLEEGADGLRNMRQRAQDIGARCEVVSKSGSGTKIVLELPWRRALKAHRSPAFGHHGQDS